MRSIVPSDFALEFTIIIIIVTIDYSINYSFKFSAQCLVIQNLLVGGAHALHFCTKAVGTCHRRRKIECTEIYLFILIILDLRAHEQQFY